MTLPIIFILFFGSVTVCVDEDLQSIKKNVKNELLYNYHIKEEEPPNIKEQIITELLNIQDCKAENIEINEDIKIKLKKDRTKPYICP